MPVVTSKLSATKFVPTSWDATFQRNKSMSPAVSKQNQNMSSARQPRRYNRDTSSEQSFSGSESTSLSPSPTPSGRGGKKKEDRMGGLALPDVVRELLKDSSVLRWDARDSVYEVVHGDNFEKRLVPTPCVAFEPVRCLFQFFKLSPSVSDNHFLLSDSMISARFATR